MSAATKPPQVGRPPVRRSRFRRWRAWRPGTVTGVLLLACLSLMLLDVRGGPTDALRAVGSWVGGPLETVTAGVTDSAGATFRRPDVAALEEHIARLAEDNRALMERNDALTEQLATAADAAAVARFRRALDRPAVTARVVAGASAPASAAVTVDAGTAAGIRPGSAVVVPAGLVGRVVAAGPTTSTVQLVTDPASAVAVRMQASRQVAMAHGTGAGRELQLGHLDPLAEVAAGDRVVTMGSPGDWPFPAGIPLGTVAAVAGAVGDLDRHVSFRPAAELGAVDHVAVLVQPEAGDPS